MSAAAYLQGYAEPECNLATAISGSWHYVLTIPAFKESAILLERLAQFKGNNRILIILLVNAPEGASSQDLACTRDLLATARGYPLLQSFNGAASLHTLSVATELLVVDRCSPHCLLPAGQGVGLARKIAGDLACALIDQGKVDFPWIFCSDADVKLPANYFEAAQQGADPGDAALVYPFQHQHHSDPHINNAQALYDFSLHYYVAGLVHAGSPYAFQSIGSTVAIAAERYASVRGFPRREAAEDFYMLNKLAKVGRVRSLAGPVIQIDSRYSDRVPFGTGAAVGKLAVLSEPLTQYRYYHPAVFSWLKAWLDALPAYHDRQSARITPADFEPAANVDASLLVTLLTDMQAEKALAHALKHGKQLQGFGKQMHDWFDGFRTLKFLHQVRDRHCPSITLVNEDFAPLLATLENPGLLELRSSTVSRVSRSPVYATRADKG